MNEFLHVRALLGILLGLGLARLLSGMARFIQHPGRQPVYAVHLGWAAFLFVLLTHLWWWEFRLTLVQDWTYAIYAVLIANIVLLYLLCTLLFPDDINEYAGFRDYFHSRRGWFFGLLALSFGVDLLDSLVKGHDYLQGLGAAYLLRNAAFIALCLAAIRIRAEWFQRAFVVAAIAMEAWWIVRLYAHLE